MDEKNDVQSVINDSRSIVKLVMCGGRGPDRVWEVAANHVTKIVPYREGESLWFAVYDGDEIGCRVNGAEVKSVYHGE